MSKLFCLTLFLFLIGKCYAQTVVDCENVNYADGAEIKFKGLPMYAYKAKKRDLIFLKDLVLKAKESSNLKCDSTVEITYLKKGKKIFKAFLSTHVTGSRYKEGAVSFNSKKANFLSLINYGTGMLIDEIYYNQKHK